MRVVKDYYVEILKSDIRTLEDAAKVLEGDGKYKILPSLLNGVADDIRNAFSNWKGGGGNDV